MSTAQNINRTNIAAFVARALNRAGASAIDCEFGLRLQFAEVTGTNDIRVEFEGGAIQLSTVWLGRSQRKAA